MWLWTPPSSDASSGYRHHPFADMARSRSRRPKRRTDVPLMATILKCDSKSKPEGDNRIYQHFGWFNVNAYRHTLSSSLQFNKKKRHGQQWVHCFTLLRRHDSPPQCCTLTLLPQMPKHSLKSANIKNRLQDPLPLKVYCFQMTAEVRSNRSRKCSNRLSNLNI